MTPEKKEQLKVCLRELAELLYEEADKSKIDNLEGIEKIVRQQVLEYVSPEIALLGATHAEETSARLHPLFLSNEQLK